MDELRRILIPVTKAGGGGMGQRGSVVPRAAPRVLLAQMGGGGAGPAPRDSAGGLSDTPTFDWSQPLPRIRCCGPAARAPTS